MGCDCTLFRPWAGSATSFTDVLTPRQPRGEPKASPTCPSWRTGLHRRVDHEVDRATHCHTTATRPHLQCAAMSDRLGRRRGTTRRTGVLRIARHCAPARQPALSDASRRGRSTLITALPGARLLPKSCVLVERRRGDPGTPLPLTSTMETVVARGPPVAQAVLAPPSTSLPTRGGDEGWIAMEGAS